jgi:hypothetical protein
MRRRQRRRGRQALTTREKGVKVEPEKWRKIA